MYDENYLLHYWDLQKSTPRDSGSDQNITEVKKDDPEQVEIDYQKIEESMYNALKRLDTENKVQEMVKSSNEPDTDVVEFSTSTDARLMTGQVVAAPTSSAQQTTAYLLDIRNILLLFLFIYFLITVYQRIKNTLSNYYN